MAWSFTKERGEFSSFYDGKRGESLIWEVIWEVMTFMDYWLKYPLVRAVSYFQRSVKVEHTNELFDSFTLITWTVILQKKVDQW